MWYGVQNMSKYDIDIKVQPLMDFRKPVDMANKLGDQCLGVFQAIRKEQWDGRERRDKLEVDRCTDQSHHQRKAEIYQR